jgi:hypothetical protein
VPAHIEAGWDLIATVPDPRTLTRKVEKLIRPAAILLSKVPGVERIGKVHSYTMYLKCSRNRASLKEWEANLAGANFTVVDQDEIRVAKAPLAYLICRSAEQK